MVNILFEILDFFARVLGNFLAVVVVFGWGENPRRPTSCCAVRRAYCCHASRAHCPQTGQTAWRRTIRSGSTWFGRPACDATVPGRSSPACQARLAPAALLRSPQLDGIHSRHCLGRKMLTVLVVHLAEVHMHPPVHNMSDHPPTGKASPERTSDMSEAVPSTETLDHRNQDEGQHDARDCPPVECGQREGAHGNQNWFGQFNLHVTLYREISGTRVARISAFIIAEGTPLYPAF